MKRFFTIGFCMLLLSNCKENKSNNENLSIELENVINNDNYHLFLYNKALFSILEENFKSDSSKYISKYQIVLKVNKINLDVDYIFRGIRAEILCALNGQRKSLAIGDTLTLKDINPSEKFITKKYYEEIFRYKLIEIKNKQKELNMLVPRDKYGIFYPVQAQWPQQDFTAEEFITRLTITENILLKHINSILYQYSLYVQSSHRPRWT